MSSTSEQKLPVGCTASNRFIFLRIAHHWHGQPCDIGVVVSRAIDSSIYRRQFQSDMTMRTAMSGRQ